ncbi:MAG: hypothetical protein ACP5XB_06925 [Isosphaeraceae bacterium]
MHTSVNFACGRLSSNEEVDVDQVRMQFPLSSKLTVDLGARVIHLPRLGIRPQCPHCCHPLDLHQPDESVPEKLLATCDLCSQWFFLIEIGKHGREVLLLELPALSVIEELVRKSRAGPE